MLSRNDRDNEFTVTEYVRVFDKGSNHGFIINNVCFYCSGSPIYIGTREPVNIRIYILILCPSVSSWCPRLASDVYARPGNHVVRPG